ncbi:MAG: redoxin domain-containing protein [Verrucomicrobia bacterium]|nr:redoxin domain-containing protein [Verrucomicrobiota bacterium]
MRNRRRNDKWLVIATAVFGLLAVLLWRPVQRELLAKLVLRSDTANETAVDQVASQLEDPVPWLERLWRSDKIPHRVLAVSYLKRNAVQNASRVERARSMLLAAASDGDLEVRQMALETLAEHHDPQLAPLAGEQLRDVDPIAKALGLNLLRDHGSAALVPVAILFLDDPDPRVVHAAATALRRWTGLDFGIRYRQIAPMRKGDKSKDANTENAEALAQGVSGWKEWWKRHQADYAVEPSVRVRSPSAWRLPAAELRLADLESKIVRLADFRGKAVLLYFWSSTIPESSLDIPSLVELQRRNTETLVVLGISLDGAGFDKCCEDHEHSHAHESKPDVAGVCARLKQVVAKQGINFRVLLDPEGEAASRYHVSELPTCVLIDPEGCVRRRFAGGRRFDTLNAMLNEIISPEPAPQTKLATEAERGKP